MKEKLLEPATEKGAKRNGHSIVSGIREKGDGLRGPVVQKAAGFLPESFHPAVGKGGGHILGRRVAVALGKEKQVFHRISGARDRLGQEEARERLPVVQHDKRVHLAIRGSVCLVKEDDLQDKRVCGVVETGDQGL